ncbi:hypothetical protein FS837_003188 [Tulasnella sp. UAMH 9824]|nr:hypothetical protein FS837_003188 [Tulasnella sp. UAMH 9824]
MDALPAELLSIIFVGALPPFASDFPHDSDPASIHARICSVCRKWNNVALSTPEFWSQITISSKLSSHNGMKRRLRLSQQSKLGVHIQLSMMSLVGGPTESFKEVHSLLVQAVGRWRSLSIKGGIFGLKDLVDYVPSILPCVEDLTFDVYELDRAAAGENLLISAPRVLHCVSNTQAKLFLQECNELREYSTAGFGFRRSRTLPWSQLVSDLHTNCAALKILEIGDNNWTSTRSLDETSSPWPPLLSLQILRFTKATHKAINTFISKINAPNLEVVELVGAAINNDDVSVQATDSEPDAVEGRAIELPPDAGWRLRFNNTTLQDIRETLEQIKGQMSIVVEIDLMGIVPEDTLAAIFKNRRGLPVPAATTAVYAFPSLEKYLEGGWNSIVNRIPSVIWVVRKSKDRWTPLVQDLPASLREVTEHIISVADCRYAL